MPCPNLMTNSMPCSRTPAKWRRSCRWPSPSPAERSPPPAAVRPPPAPQPPQQATPRQPPSTGTDLLSSLGNGLDPKLLMRLLPLLQELGGQQDSNARALLYALRPYLKPERQEKVERALQLARLFHLGKKFLAGWEG